MRMVWYVALGSGLGGAVRLLLGGGLITLERARVVMYGPDLSPSP